MDDREDVISEFSTEEHELQAQVRDSEQALEKAAQARREPTLITRVFGAGRVRN